MFVFFKQKTAYEMRISDWSSDVCSSDLADCSIYLGISTWVLTEHLDCAARGIPSKQRSLRTIQYFNAVYASKLQIGGRKTGVIDVVDISRHARLVAQ